MPKSFRIRTNLNEDRNLQVKLEQNFDTLEILSLTVTPDEIYTRSCADFGVICGRVYSNNGFGIPNARVSIFVPLEAEDLYNDVISALYPYKTLQDVNEDGYKYNLLPYTSSHSGHIPVGTFPDRSDVLIDKNVIQVYDKYYKFTVQTNDSGDYMIFGVPVGSQEIFMQVDLSDIGPFSQTPQDLIRMGRANENQVDGDLFKFSTNYDALPQIVTIRKTVAVAPFYGEPEICNYNIYRADFDLTNEAGIKIEPTAVFMGSIFSTNDSQKINYSRFLGIVGQNKCKSSIKMGNLCDLITGPGSIEAIRQTEQLDETGFPILEEFKLDNGGKVIDENGVWVTEVPMNLDYVYTDEYGNQKISYDPKIGIPTRGKYRFKVKWQQSTKLSEETKRGYYLVPNIKEYGWFDNLEDPVKVNFTSEEQEETLPVGDLSLTIPVSNGYVVRIVSVTNSKNYKIYNDDEIYYGKNLRPLGPPYNIQFEAEDPNQPINITYITYPYQQFLLEGSYAFSLDWNDYANYEDAIDCKDTFYDMSYNKVYTVSNLIDRFQTSRFVWNTTQVKYIQDNTCEGNYNKFPINDSHFRLNFLWFFVSFVISVLPYLLFAIVAVVHVLSWVYDNILPVIDNIINKIRNVIEKICASVNKALGKLGLDSWKINCPDWDDIDRPDNPFLNIGLPLVLYTDDGCERCRCNISNVTVASPLLTGSYGQTSILFDATASSSYNFENILNATSYFVETYNTPNQTTEEKWRDGANLVLAGNDDPELKETVNTPWVYYFDDQRGADSIILSPQLNMSSLYNLFNLKDKYFEQSLTNGGNQTYYTGWNQIKVKWQPQNNFPYDNNNKHHFDNIMMLVLDEGQSSLVSGDIITFQDPSKSLDKNYNKGVPSQTGSTGFTKAVTELTVKYADPTITNGGTNANRTTTYAITGFPENIVWSIQIPSGQGPVAPIVTYASSTSTGKYPMDIEYFQVLTGMTLGEFKTRSEEKQNPFTLGRRYLQIKDKSNQNIAQNNLYSISNSFTNKHQVILWSKNGGNMSNPDLPPTWASQYMGVVEPSQDPTYLNKRILILMRGVDVHSPSIDMKIDLSRIFGKWTYDWSPGYYSDRYVLEGKFKMNIPIQASLSTVGANSISSTNHYLLSSNNGTSGGYDKTTKSTIFHKSYLFEYKSLGQNGFKPFDSHMHKYYSGVGPALIDGYSDLNWTNDLGSQTTSIVSLLDQYKQQVDNRLWASGDESVPPNSGYYPIQTNYSIATKNLTVSENNFYRKRFFDLYYFNGEYKYYGLNNIGAVTFATTNNTNQFSLSNYLPNENIEGGEMIESSFTTGGDSYDFGSLTLNLIKTPNQPVINIFDNDLVGGLDDDNNYSVNKWGPNNYQDENGRRGAQMFSFDYFAPEDPTDISQGTYPIQFNSYEYNVVRTDRLPSSTTLNRFGANTMFLHQNPDFSVFKIGENGANELTNVTQISVSANEGNDLLAPEYQGVLQSVQDCSYAVLQKCYSFDPINNVPVISEQCQSYMTIGDIVKFKYGTGCYNLVSVAFDSFRTDIESVKEWAARLKMNLAVCLDVFSHTFSNQYINGTLYMYPFKNNRFFDEFNRPFSEYCTDVVYLNSYSNTFYYRSSPYITNTNTLNDGKFIGKPNPIGNNSNTGNNRLLGSPTTILDLGPKVIYTQELVFSDDYDGYIMNRLKSTSYQGITQVMNMFILSRITSPTLSKLVIPQSDDPNEGDNDAGVQSLFQNTRWFKNPSNIETLIPQSVDGDLSQMLSINSEFGIVQFTPENYPGDTVYFGFSSQGVTDGFATFGIFFTGDTQARDYITPRRTIWNQNSSFPVNNDYDFTRIPVKTQVVPFYNWKISDFNSSGELSPTTIFGTQKNDWYTEIFNITDYPQPFQSFGYQSLDRLDPASRYFQSNIVGNKTKTAQNYITNLNQTDGSLSYSIPTNSNFSNYFIAGSPFHFYFGLKNGASALDVFIKKYLNENSIIE